MLLLVMLYSASLSKMLYVDALLLIKELVI